jgi:uncharacterized protein YodC (DUF2158 family)
MKKFRIGDLVVLKSGGPTMTVSAGRHVCYDEVCCAWFDVTNQVKEFIFHENVLAPFKAEEEKSANSSID